MKTINLKRTSVAKPRNWFQWRRRWHDPREARPEGSQFRASYAADGYARAVSPVCSPPLPLLKGRGLR
jgi:hypothetical protein